MVAYCKSAYMTVICSFGDSWQHQHTLYIVTSLCLWAPLAADLSWVEGRDAVSSLP